MTNVYPFHNAPDSLKRQVKESVARSLRLTMAPEEIEDDITLFGTGLGLDSIDALELIIELERSFKLKITDEEMGKRVLGSVNAIVSAIEELRANTADGSAPSGAV